MNARSIGRNRNGRRPAVQSWFLTTSVAVGDGGVAAASILKDVVNRIGDLLDDGKPNSSFKG